MRVIIASSIDSPAGLEFTHIEPDTGEQYAILSHTWGADGDEVIYTDILEGKARSRVTYENKIAFTCRRAVADGFRYVWIDTCCIDKSSSAELSEAINSMFNWYRHSAVCYALLSDVPSTSEINSYNSAFARSRWFTRGFTLQELLAPPDVVFYSEDWIELGTKASLGDTLATITKIDMAVLIGDRPIEATSIANRMGWAANRVTKRPEDIAYCLMGIFSVNMPLLYGEGSKAFIRLQEEIMKTSTDYSLFAWFDETAPDDELKGVLARSPSMFSRTSAICPFVPSGKREPYSMTNMGLSIQLPVSELADSEGIFVACIHCPTPDASEGTMFGIYLKKLDTAKNDRRFSRVRAATYYSLSVYEHSSKMDIYLSIYPTPWDVTASPNSPLSRPFIRFDQLPLPGWVQYYALSLTVYPSGKTYTIADHSRWRRLIHESFPAVYLREGENKISCAMSIKLSEVERFLILFGTGDSASTMVYYVVNMRDGLHKPDYSPDRIPDIHELEALFHRAIPLGNTSRSGSAEFCLRKDQHKGREINVQVNVRRLPISEKSKVRTPKKGDTETEDSKSGLRKQLSRLKLLG
ncbi:hypothetical protein FQN54_004810 [Arachnomyces sp. PD_36]|nr:hypothetical protein FQN54_004810 [Arachnomyces sp. PD_36]